MADELHYLTAGEARRLFVNRELSPVELMEATIARIEAVDPAVNAVPIRSSTTPCWRPGGRGALPGKGGAPRPLEGIPVAVKDEVEVACQPCTPGSLVFEDEIAEVTAGSVQRVIDAGGIIHVRTTTPSSAARRSPSRGCGASRATPGTSTSARAARRRPGRRAGGRHDDPRHRLRHRRLHPHPGLVLRRGRLQAALRPRAPATPFNLDHYCHEGPLARSVDDCRLLENVRPGRTPNTSPRCGPAHHTGGAAAGGRHEDRLQVLPRFARSRPASATRSRPPYAPPPGDVPGAGRHGLRGRDGLVACRHARRGRRRPGDHLRYVDRRYYSSRRTAICSRTYAIGFAEDAAHFTRRWATSSRSSVEGETTATWKPCSTTTIC